MNEFMDKLSEFISKAVDVMYEKGKSDTIDVVLEITDSVSDDWLEDNCDWDWHGEMKERVLSLKGGKE